MTPADREHLADIKQRLGQPMAERSLEVLRTEMLWLVLQLEKQEREKWIP